MEFLFLKITKLTKPPISAYSHTRVGYSEACIAKFDTRSSVRSGVASFRQHEKGSIQKRKHRQQQEKSLIKAESGPQGDNGVGIVPVPGI
jgi:hypothetical protein